MAGKHSTDLDVIPSTSDAPWARFTAKSVRNSTAPGAAPFLGPIHGFNEAPGTVDGPRGGNRARGLTRRRGKGAFGILEDSGRASDAPVRLSESKTPQPEPRAKTRPPHRWRAAALALLLGFSGLDTAAAIERAAEPNLHLAFLYRFLFYVEWPSTRLAEKGEIVVCVAGDAAESGLRALAEAEVSGHRVRAIRVDGKRSTSDCHVPYFADAEHSSWALLSSVVDEPVLTVGAAPSFLREGGIIRFTKRRNRVHFEISTEAVSRAGLSVSSLLLEVADVAEPSP